MQEPDEPESNPDLVAKLVAEIQASWDTPEMQERIRYLEEHGCPPEHREDRDRLLAEGYSRAVANRAARFMHMERLGLDPDIEDYL